MSNPDFNSFSARLGMHFMISSRSDAGMKGGRLNAMGLTLGDRAKLMTAHHRGMVLDKASGNLFPDRVESTMMHLWSCVRV